MKVLLLAGGLGTRLSEETDIRPKPMVEVGGEPILWHIMKIYSSFGFNDFVVLLGHKGYVIKEYFANYFLHRSDVTVDLQNGQVSVLNNASESWKVTLLDTGKDSMTGGRVKRAQSIVGESPFLLTYGDGVGDIQIDRLVAFHKEQGSLITMTAVQPEGRFGALQIEENNRVVDFLEKPKGDGHWVNAGFFVCESQVFDYITEGDSTIFEQTPLKNLAKDNKMSAYRHHGFWRPMDTLKDKTDLNRLWQTGQAPWKVW